MLFQKLIVDSGDGLVGVENGSEVEGNSDKLRLRRIWRYF